MKNLNLKFLTLLAVLALTIPLTGCDEDDETRTITGVPIDTTVDLGEGASLRVVHASPDAPAVDIYVEGVATPVIKDLDYKSATDYLDLDPGTYNIQIRAAGAARSTDPVFETGDLTIPQDAVITALAAGFLASSDEADRFRVLPLVENFADPGAGNAAVRIIHASADAPTVAIDVGNDGTPEIPALDRFAETGEDGVALPAGSSLAIGIWAGNPLARVTAFTTPALPAANLLVIATGELGMLPRDETGFGLLAIGPDGVIGLIKQDPTVFVLHASPDAPPVDVYVGGTATELVDNLSFGAISPPVQVPPAAYELDIRVWDNGSVEATVSTPELMAGERYLAVASGYVGGSTPSFTLLPYREDFASSAGALVRVIHASPDAPPVDVGTWDGMNFGAVGDFSGLGFGESSTETGTGLPSAMLTIGVAGVGTRAPVATFDLDISADLRAFAVASGSLGATGESFRLVLVDATMFPWQAVEVMPNP